MRSALFALLVLTASTARAAPQLVASFEDPPGDGYGPGTYQLPGDTEFQAGDFDLRRFAVYVDGDDAVLEVTLGAPIRRPAVTQRTNETDLELWNGIYLQNIDIYADSGAGEGFTACIPGRRVGFVGTWKAAVVLTPQPGPARSITESALGKTVASHVVFAENPEVKGPTLRIRVPAVALGGKPTKEWGWSVQVSGASWERTFAVARRLTGTSEANAFTMPVLAVPEAWAFGGAPEGNAYPRVIDVLLPPDADQKRVLGSFDSDTGEWAKVPFVYGRPRPVPLQTTPAAPQTNSSPDAKPAAGLSVVDVTGDMVSISGPAAGLKPLQFGRVLGKDGAVVAHVVVFRVLETGGLLAEIVDGKDRIQKGARVEFGRHAP